jgi:F1F0 ATPase subunit 2
MSNVLSIIFALLCGTTLGTLFFGGLWWTVHRGLHSGAPALWFLGSLLLRSAAVIVGFLWIAHGEFDRLIACLIGFLAARVMVAAMLKPAP